MNVLKASLTSAVLVASAVGAAVPAANAWLAPGPIYRYPADGGTWKYGFWDAKVRSYYYHGSRCHGSTVEYNGNRVRSIDTAGGQWSSADKWAYNAWYNDDAYWYRTC